MHTGRRAEIAGKLGNAKAMGRHQTATALRRCEVLVSKWYSLITPLYVGKWWKMVEKLTW
jgi:hypothetical protein